MLIGAQAHAATESNRDDAREHPDEGPLASRIGARPDVGARDWSLPRLRRAHRGHPRGSPGRQRPSRCGCHDIGHRDRATRPPCGRRRRGHAPGRAVDGTRRRRRVHRRHRPAGHPRPPGLGRGRVRRPEHHPPAYSARTISGAGRVSPGRWPAPYARSRLDHAWDDHITGRGVDVALIDSGVAPVDGLDRRRQGRQRPGPLVRPPGGRNRRTSTRSGTARTWPGIIAGRDDAIAARRASPRDDEFVGVAPGARIVSIKVAEHRAQTDVSQVIAAIDWVVQHRTAAASTSACSTSRSAPTASRTTGSTRSPTRSRSPGGTASSSSSPPATPATGAPELNNPAYDPYVHRRRRRTTPKGTNGTRRTTASRPWSSRGDGSATPTSSPPA